MLAGLTETFSCGEKAVSVSPAWWRMTFAALFFPLSGCVGVVSQDQQSSVGENWYHDPHWEDVVVAQDELDSQPRHSPLYHAVRDAAGPGGRDCIDMLPKGEMARRLLLSENAARRPVYCSGTSPGIDSYTGWGVSSLVSGELYLFYYDSSPCGGFGKCSYALRRRRCEQLDVLPDDPDIQPKNICVKPEF